MKPKEFMKNNKIFKIVYITFISLIILVGCGKNKTTTSVENIKKENKTEITETSEPTKMPTKEPKEEKKKKITDKDIRKAAEIIKKNSIIEQSKDYKETCSDKYPEHYDYDEGVAEIKEYVGSLFDFNSNTKESKIMYKIVEFILNDGFDVNKLTFDMYEDGEHFTFEYDDGNEDTFMCVDFALNKNTNEIEVHQFDYKEDDWKQYSTIQEALDKWEPFPY